MRRLYFRIYLTIVFGLVVFGIAMVLLWWTLPPREPPTETFMKGLASILVHALRPSDTKTQRKQVLETIAREGKLNLTLINADGGVEAATGVAQFVPRPNETGWAELDGRGHAVVFLLDAGAWLVASETDQHQRHRSGRFVFALVVLAVAIAIAAYPMSRRLTRRLETLGESVERLGKGELSARVAVTGRDEVSQLAISFNRCAERIESLVSNQRAMLAGASHELRSPLARIRLALDLMANPNSSVNPKDVARDIDELEELIDELLTASRLSTTATNVECEVVDVLGVVAEEALRVGAEVSGESAQITGNLRLIRRLVRNLLENAQRYGDNTPIEASVKLLPNAAVELIVQDAGRGVPETDWDKIFMPFYRTAKHRTESRSGVGLGLALVRQIAERHGGSATCGRREGGGSRFVVVLRDIGNPPAMP